MEEATFFAYTKDVEELRSRSSIYALSELVNYDTAFTKLRHSSRDGNCRGNAAPWKTPLGAQSREVYRPSDGRPRGREEVAVPFGPHTNLQRTRSPSSLAFPPSTTLFLY